MLQLVVVLLLKHLFGDLRSFQHSIERLDCLVPSIFRLEQLLLKSVLFMTHSAKVFHLISQIQVPLLKLLHSVKLGKDQLFLISSSRIRWFIKVQNWFKIQVLDQISFSLS